MVWIQANHGKSTKVIGQIAEKKLNTEDNIFSGQKFYMTYFYLKIKSMPMINYFLI